MDKDTGALWEAAYSHFTDAYIHWEVRGDWSSKDFNEARRLYLELIPRLEAEGNKSALACVYADLGRMAKTQGHNLEEASLFYGKSLELKKALDEKEGVADIYKNLGRVAEKRGDLEEAMRFYYQTLELFKVLNCNLRISLTYRDLGKVAEKMGNLEEAVQIYSKLLELSEAEGIAGMEGVSVAFEGLGNIERQRNNTRAATHFFHKSLEAAEKRGIEKIIARANVNLARVARDRNDLSLWYEYMQEAKELYEKSGAGIFAKDPAGRELFDVRVELMRYEKRGKFQELLEKLLRRLQR